MEGLTEKRDTVRSQRYANCKSTDNYDVPSRPFGQS
jgi:hypothetical protein